MLSLFPYFLSYQQLSPLIIRVTLGVVFLYWAYTEFKKACSSKVSNKEKVCAIVEAFSGAFLIIGLWTQAAALVAIIGLVIEIAGKIRKRAFLTDGVNYYILLLVMAISLIFTGAGALAFDLPL